MSLFSASLEASSSEDASNQGIGNLMLTASHGTHLDTPPPPSPTANKTNPGLCCEHSDICQTD